MLTRLLTGIVLVILLAPVIVFYDTVAVPVVFAIISAVSIYEMAKCIGYTDKKHVGVVILAAALVGALPFAQYFMPSLGISLALAVASIVVYVVYALGVFNVTKPFEAAPQFLTTVIYVSGAVISIVAIASLPNGGLILPFVFLGSWLTDTFAYLCGTFFGRHKLIPRVSPKKTVEGSVGAVIFTVVSFAAYGVAVAGVTGLTVNYAALIVTGLLLSAVSQIGDLNASFIKRTYGVKDYGNIFPGHGGMFDRFDSVMAVSPVIYIAALIFTYFI